MHSYFKKHVRLILFHNIVAHSLEESIGAKDVGNTMETGQKEQLYYRTAKNSCQKYVFGRMYGKLSFICFQH